MAVGKFESTVDSNLWGYRLWGYRSSLTNVCWVNISKDQNFTDVTVWEQEMLGVEENG